MHWIASFVILAAAVGLVTGTVTWLILGMPRILPNGDVVAYTLKPSQFPITINGETYEERVAEDEMRIETTGLLDGKVEQCLEPYSNGTCLSSGDPMNYTVELYDAYNPDKLVYSRKTDQWGNYLFRDIAPGRYIIYAEGATLRYGNLEKDRITATDKIEFDLPSIKSDYGTIGAGGHSLWIYLPHVEAGS